jgi:formamidopyrimidine-DNA glycosylase
VPELPEVEAGRLLVRAVAVGRRIVAVRCVADPIVLDGVTPARLRRALLGRRVLAVHRHGKHLWLSLDRRPWPCLHFGMTGGLHAPRRPGVRLVSSNRWDAEAGWPPRFLKLLLTLDDGGQLAFADARRLGRIRLRHDPATEPPISELGFDALRGIPPARRFRELVRARRTAIKALLLDQTFAAGVGNWIADEVLYQSRIDPRRPAAGLSDAEIARLRARLRGVVATAVSVGGNSERFPRAWLFHDRWGRNAEARTTRGDRIRYATVGGRTTAWVPAVQGSGFRFSTTVARTRGRAGETIDARQDVKA